MRIFYVRPGKEGGYGEGDGSSYDNAWNGFKAIDWHAVSAAEPATVWVCGNPGERSDFMTVHVEWSYLQQHTGRDLEPAAEERTDSRRESPQPV
jgi:hypothetical protein